MHILYCVWKVSEGDIIERTMDGKNNKMGEKHDALSGQKRCLGDKVGDKVIQISVDKMPSEKCCTVRFSN